MKHFLALVALAVLCNCGSSSSGGGNTPPPNGDFTLSINNFDGWCTVTVNGAAQNSATYSFAPGTVVMLGATANVGFMWAYWLGTAGAGGNGMDTNMNTTVTMSADESVLACCNNATQKCPTSL